LFGRPGIDSARRMEPQYHVFHSRHQGSQKRRCANGFGFHVPRYG